MPRNRARFPVAGLAAFAVSLTALCGQFALLTVPRAADEPAYAASAWGARAEREAQESRARASRLLAGLVVLGVGSGLGGAAAVVAARGRHTDRALAAASGACCIGSMVVWLIMATLCVNLEPDRDRPSLTVDRY